MAQQLLLRIPKEKFKEIKNKVKSNITIINDKDVRINNQNTKFIIPTIFPINTECIEKVTTIDNKTIVEKIVCSKEKFGNNGFTYVYHRLENIMYTINPNYLFVLLYIITNIPMNSNAIELNYNIILSITTVSKSTYYNALSELINKNIICPTNKKNIYLVNTMYMFRGNLSIFKEEYDKRYKGINVEDLIDQKGRVIIPF